MFMVMEVTTILVREKAKRIEKNPKVREWKS